MPFIYGNIPACLVIIMDKHAIAIMAELEDV